MGFRRIRNITLVFFLFFSYSFSDMQVIIENDTSFWGKIWENFISTFFSTVSALLLAYWGIRRERKKEEKNLRQEWYNKIILEKLIDPISDYYDFVDENLQELNTGDIVKLEISRSLRTSVRHKLDYLKIFDDNLYSYSLKNIENSIDNYTSSMDLRVIKRKNNDLKKDILERIYKKSKNL